MRHAEAPNVLGIDFERILSQHGHEQALKAADFLNEYKLDVIVTSDAPRVLETSLHIEKNFHSVKIIRDHNIYNGDSSYYISLLESLYKEFDNILLIGHNPSIFSAAFEISEKTHSNFHSLAISGMSPAKIVVFKIKKAESNLRLTDKCLIEKIFED